ncbi:MAG: hypothetical protein L0Y72_19840 [Gemmataceae bacterium]|nr:hypothetical protein [Gemmataceae bacterium]MCI0741290.1 hypothetical protein [Gemmataceae bacterium]
MAEERKETKAAWTKLFTTFKVALDVKKLLLAAAGIVAMALGWWLLAVVFYGVRSVPQAPDFITEKMDEAQKREAFTSLKSAREKWNLLYEMAGPAPSSPKDAKRVDAVDLADNYDEYIEIQAIVDAHQRLSQTVEVRKQDADYYLIIDGTTIKKRITNALDPKDTAPLDKAKERKFTVADLTIVNDKDNSIRIDATLVKVEGNIEDLQKFRAGAGTPEAIRDSQLAKEGAKKEVISEAYRMYVESLKKPQYKPAGRLRTLPWFEDRGPNPYLLVAESFKETGTAGTRDLPWAKGGFVGWLLHDQLPVLVEPLVKFLSPIMYFFDARAGGWNRFYLIFVILWTLLVWGFFGGAITRMAAVQLAKNEKISMAEAIKFAKERCQSFFSAPLFPLIFLGILSFFLIIFGIFEGHTYFLGDIFIAGLLWPIVIVLGLIMAVVLVGLVGWPLMNPTISTEGSDSFDALSRSYSYVYQRPWHYIWYSSVALAYGAALVFFVGLMGSLIVYLGQWAVGQAPFLSSTDPTRDREPTYLFVYSPTSFGWRDLLIHSSPFAERKEAVTAGGMRTVTYQLKESYRENLSWHNKVGAFLVSIWIYLFFLLIVGFGYSYFWTASTAIYLLMRQVVDDTDFDEVHMEEGEMEDTFTQHMAPTPTAVNTGLQMVDPPAVRVPPPPPAPPSPPPVPPAPTPAPPAPATGGDGNSPSSGPTAEPSPSQPTGNGQPPGEGQPPSGDSNPPPPSNP